VAERVVRGVRHRLRPSRTDVPADVVALPPVGPAAERVLLGLCRLDDRLLRRRDLPFGSSVFLAAVRR
jgi:hypothetical protein